MSIYRRARTHHPYEQNGVGVVPLNHGVNAYIDVADLPAVASHLWHLHKPKGSQYPNRNTNKEGASDA